jgi:hypothetical protein
MKNKWTIMAATVAALVGFSASVQAVPVSGTIEFIGGSTVNTGNLGTATAITGYSSLSVLGLAETGSYAPLNGGGNFGGTLTFSTFGFGGNVLNPASVLLWTLTSGGITYSFTATSVFISSQSPTFLNLTGTGYANITGYTATLGTWSITDTAQGGQVFTFGAATTVPDGGTTVMLLGAAFAGLCLYRKKVMA